MQAAVRKPVGSMTLQLVANIIRLLNAGRSAEASWLNDSSTSATHYSLAECRPQCGSRLA